uniref:ZP domain-containing protein n=1 Tax=Heterorhabditis bacteriophora TaxID=37862 RepID=A0A1I7XV81_HETBA
MSNEIIPSKYRDEVSSNRKLINTTVSLAVSSSYKRDVYSQLLSIRCQIPFNNNTSPALTFDVSPYQTEQYKC